jgi:hypothetical protein
MNVQNVGNRSLGEWASICRQWAKAHGESTVEPPTEDEFEAAIMAARGL